MVDVRVRRPVAPSDVEDFRRVADDAARAAGHPVVGDAVWLDLANPSADTALVVARDHDATVAAMHVGAADSVTTPHITLSVAVTPEAALDAVVPPLTAVALADRRHRGGGPVELWVLGADGAWDVRAERLGLHPARELRQLRVALPVDEPVRWPDGITVRAFAPGRDEAAWLEVNNQTFADDPDQGGWTEAALLRREREPWFDPAGFLLAEDETGLAGFCWTKRHPATAIEPLALGEIYVIGVEPSRQGRGLGRPLTLAGLADLHDRRRITVGILFVDSGNSPALRLYESIGFTVARVDRAYACHL